VRLLSLLIERWFDRRLLPVVLDRFRQREDAGEIDPARTVVYRVPLPDTVELTVRGPGAEPRTIRRSLAEFIGLGDRLYVADAAPGARFGHPVALFVFRGLRTRPLIELQTRTHFFVNEAPFPWWAPATLRGWAIHNAPAIPAPPFAGPPIEATTVPLRAPFPPRNRPSPVPGGTFTPNPQPTGAAAGTGAPPCPPVYRFYGLCLQHPLEPAGQAGRDGILDDLDRIAVAFNRRGYRPRSMRAGMPHRTFDALMQAFEDDLNADADFCRCPDDQLVIVIGAHGENGSVQFQADKDTVESVGFPQLMLRLSRIAKIAANPSKVYLIFDSCRSGQIFAGGVPGTLAGMHVITSAPNAFDVSYMREFARWIEEALARGTVVTWEDFVDATKYAWSNDPNHVGKPPTNGDLGGCRVRVRLVSVQYAGTNLGARWRFEIRIGAQETQIPEHALAHGQTTTIDREVYDGLEGPCPKQVDLFIGTEPVFIDASGESHWYNGSTARFRCDGTNTSAHAAVNPVDKGGANTVLTINYEIRTQCV
jgi:hypothetical protein